MTHFQIDELLAQELPVLDYQAAEQELLDIQAVQSSLRAENIMIDLDRVEL